MRTFMLLALSVPDNPKYPHKIAFREGVVLHEVDRWGERIEATA
jgi:hypothetical protein